MRNWIAETAQFPSGPRLTLRALAAAPLIACVLGASLAYAQDGRGGKPRPIPCGVLTSLALPGTTITLAEALPAGANQAPVGTLPTPICRVVGVGKPAINFEVWLPTDTWNGKFQGIGNDGIARGISYAEMRTALGRGYATASTDTGHVSSEPLDSAWALGRPDLVADFGHRGLHVTTVNAKQIIRAFYGKHPDYSYFVGCSKGGQQALMEAQRYPEDYDGIIAGSPANNWTRQHAGAHLWYSIAMLKDPESYIPAAKTALLGNAVTATCDAIDGIVDGVLDDPRKCKFDPAVLTCKQRQDPATCYTPKQVKAIKDIWTGVRNSRGELIHQPLLPGGEAGDGGWAAWITGSAPFNGLHWLAADGFFKYQVFEDPNFNVLNLNFDADLDFALAKVGPILDATDPDLRPFGERGGKLLMYHGWSDPHISPLNTIDYYESVISTLKRRNQAREEAAQDVREFARLFMVPGMQHCSGGPGPNTFDMLTALENWVEKRKPPTQIIASLVANNVVTRTRPLCPYPQVAAYSGSSSVDDAANFVCRNPPSASLPSSSPPSPPAPSASASSAPAPSSSLRSAPAPSAPASSAPAPSSSPPSASAPSALASSAPPPSSSLQSSSLPSAPAPSALASSAPPPSSSLQSSSLPSAPAPSAQTSQTLSAAPSAATLNGAPIWQPGSTIDFVEGLPAVVSMRDFVRDPDSDPLVITLKSGVLLPGLTWNPTNYTIVYDGRPMGAKGDAPIVVAGLVFVANDVTPAPTAPPSAPPPSAPPPSAPPPSAPPPSAPPPSTPPPSTPPPTPLNRAPIWQPAPTISFVEGVPAVVSVREFVRDPDLDPLVITLKSGQLLPGLTWNPTNYTIAYDGRRMGAKDDAPVVVTGPIFVADDRRP